MRPAQKGAQAAAIGRSRGGLTTKLHAAVDAIGLPIRIHPTPGHYGDRPQAETLLAGLSGVGHVIADAGYDADPLRAFIVEDLKAVAQIKANPSRTKKPSIDWRLYKERHQVECFFNRLKRFRRIVLRCEKTLPAFMGFPHPAPPPATKADGAYGHPDFALPVAVGPTPSSYLAMIPPPSSSTLREKREAGTGTVSHQQ